MELPSWPKPVGFQPVSLAASGNLNPLTEALQDVPNCAFVTPSIGRWLVIGAFDFLGTVAAFSCFGACIAAGVDLGNHAIFAAGAVNDRDVVTLSAVTPKLAAGQVVKLQAKQNGGTYACFAGNTTLAAIRVE